MSRLLRTFQEIEATNSPNQKQSILSLNSDLVILKLILKYALDPYKRFGIAKPVKLNCHATHDPGPGYFSELFCHLENLATRRITGKAAIEATEAIISRAGIYHDLANRILLKDLKCGLQEKTVNKVFKKLITKFEVAKAHDYDDYVNGKGRAKPPWICGIKYEGTRTSSFLAPKEEPTFLSRNGLPRKGYHHIKKELVHFSNWFKKPVWLDGELMWGMWGDRSIQEDQAEYILFEMLYPDEWGTASGRIQVERTLELFKVMKAAKEELDLRYIFQEEFIVAYTLEEMLEFYAQAVMRGEEGIMLKNPFEVYHNKRHKAWLKYKPTYTEDVEITGTYPLSEELTTAKRKRLEAIPGWRGQGLGGFTALYYPKLKDGNRAKEAVKVKIGGGFSETQIVEFWNNREDYPGQVIEIEHKLQMPSGKLRYPQFVRFREDK